MNKYIQQFALIAGWDEHQAVYDTRIQAFAEQIIQQCARIALEDDYDAHDCILDYFETVAPLPQTTRPQQPVLTQQQLQLHNI
jgi:hypothetical protein